MQNVRCVGIPDAERLGQNNSLSNDPGRARRQRQRSPIREVGCKTGLAIQRSQAENLRQ
jgi:hypothetical protein